MTKNMDTNPHLKCPRCGDLNGQHIAGCKLQQPIFSSQRPSLTPDDRAYLKVVQQTARAIVDGFNDYMGEQP